jgi:hypothetical protein
MSLAALVRERMKEKNGSLHLCSGRDCNFAWKLTEASFFCFPSFARKVGFDGLLRFQSSCGKLPICLGFQLPRVWKLPGSPNKHLPRSSELRLVMLTQWLRATLMIALAQV